MRHPPESATIPIIVQPAEILDGPLRGEDITVTVKGMHMGWEGGQPGTRAEYLKGWLREVTLEKDPGTQRWEKLLSLMKLAFCEGRLPVALTWTTMVLIPKGGGYYRGIGILEVIWKVCASIMNNQLRSAITLHNKLHVFR